MTIIFLTVDQIIEIHEDQIKRFGGAEEIRDYGLLESAVFQAQTTFDGSLLHDSWQSH